MNILVVVVLLVLFWKISIGYKRGMVKEIISLVSLIVLCIVVALLGSALNSYFDKEIIGIIVAVLLLGVVGVVHHLLGVVFFSAKVLSKLPVVHWIDKLLGIVVGGLETVMLLWTLYLLVMNLGLGMFGQQILVYTKDNVILSWLYRYNMLAVLFEHVMGKINFL